MGLECDDWDRWARDELPREIEDFVLYERDLERVACVGILVFLSDVACR